MCYNYRVRRQGRHRFRKMDNARMQAAFADMFDQWVKAKEQAQKDHPEWSPEQVDLAVSNAFMAAMRSVG